MKIHPTTLVYDSYPSVYNILESTLFMWFIVVSHTRHPCMDNKQNMVCPFDTQTSCKRAWFSSGQGWFFGCAY